MNKNYLLKEIRDLSKNFDGETQSKILDAVADNHFNTIKLKSLYDELMEVVYGDGGIKGY
tara:strand:- start:210 stop:389 length:180 start_codon:yes stop_codon:yes gene_type:complete